MFSKKDSIHAYLPTPQKIIVPDRKGVETEITMRFLVWDDYQKITKEIGQIINQIANKEGKIEIDKNDMSKVIDMLMPVIDQVKVILLMSIDKSEDWFNQNMSLAAISHLINKFFEVNGIDQVIENFKKAGESIKKKGVNLKSPVSVR